MHRTFIETFDPGCPDFEALVAEVARNWGKRPIRLGPGRVAFSHRSGRQAETMRCEAKREVALRGLAITVWT